MHRQTITGRKLLNSIIYIISVRPSLQASLVPSSSNHNIGTHHMTSYICIYLNLPALQKTRDANLYAMDQVGPLRIRPKQHQCIAYIG